MDKRNKCGWTEWKKEMIHMDISENIGNIVSSLFASCIQ